MATLKYFTKGNRNPSSIYMRLVHGRKVDVTRSTSLLIQPEYWNSKKGEVRKIAAFADKVNLQNKLNDLKSVILNNFNDDYANGKFINGDWLEDQIRSFFNQAKENDLSFLSEYARYYIENLPNKVQKNGTVGLAKSTITKFKSTFQKILDYEKHKNKKIRLIEVDFKFHKDFIHFLHNEQQLNYNTTGKYLSNIKAICKAAKRDGQKVHPDIEHEEFRVPKKETHFVTLNLEEVDKIFAYDFSDTPYLKNARDWLIIGVWTGARGRDLLDLTEKNIHNGLLEYKAKKTGQLVTAGIHPQVEEIMESGMPYKISLQKYNDYIKEVCRRVGINEKVKGSKYIQVGKTKEGKIPTPVLMSQTGHKTEKMFLKYIGKTEKDNAQILKEYWERQQKD